MVFQIEPNSALYRGISLIIENTLYREDPSKIPTSTLSETVTNEIIDLVNESAKALDLIEKLQAKRNVIIVSSTPMRITPINPSQYPPIPL